MIFFAVLYCNFELAGVKQNTNASFFYTSRLFKKMFEYIAFEILLDARTPVK